MHERDYNARNVGLRANVQRYVKPREQAVSIAFAGALIAGSLLAATADYLNGQRKIDSIESGRLRAGSRVTLTYPELAAWAAHEAPDGVRDLHIRVTTPQIA